MAKDAFEAEGRTAKLGPYAFGFAWGGWASVVLATVLFCLNIRKSKTEKYAASTPRYRGGDGTAGKRRFPYFGKRANKGSFA